MKFKLSTPEIHLQVNFAYMSAPSRAIALLAAASVCKRKIHEMSHFTAIKDKFPLQMVDVKSICTK